MIPLTVDLEECGVPGKLTKFNNLNQREWLITQFNNLRYIVIYLKIWDISQEVRQRTANP